MTAALHLTSKILHGIVAGGRDSNLEVIQISEKGPNNIGCITLALALALTLALAPAPLESEWHDAGPIHIASAQSAIDKAI
jgi:hypothetical protein